MAYGDGEISAGHVDVVARLWANPRVRRFLPEAEEALVAEAKAGSCRAFRDVAKEWERLVDEDGALALTDRHHENRFVSMHHDFNGSWQLTDGFGASQGAVVAEILDRYELVELDADWAKARAEHGDNASVEHLGRTAQQRRADALWNVFVTAASTPSTARRPEPLVNIVMTQHEWKLAVARAVGPSGRAQVDGGSRGCSTVEGNPIDPLDAFGAALAGEVRRVVVDGAGVAIDLGRAARLFTGPARDAALLSGAGCVWPGCDQTGTKNQVDHLIEWQHDGHTDQQNAGVLCRFHNRWKSTHGYRLHRDPDGSWHTTKPDGTILE